MITEKWKGGERPMESGVTFASFNTTRLDTFWRFICERQMVWTKRTLLKLPSPWTDDPILRAERFTNIYREIDPGTQYVIQEVMERDAPKEDKVFNVMLYRLIGRSETHQAIGFQSVETFDPTHLVARLHAIRDEGRSPFTAAYLVSGYASMGTHDKAENIARLFTELRDTYPAFYGRLTACPSSEAAYEVLRSVKGFGNFLAYQVLVDLLYPLACYDGTALLPFTHDDWASAGPGAQRGVKMLLNPDENLPPLPVMRWLRAHQHEEFARLGLDFPYLIDERSQQPRDISLANIQNCLCEFHKYVKIGNGTGKGRRKFAKPVSAPKRQQLTLGEGFAS
jgi:hypothetical protein